MLTPIDSLYAYYELYPQWQYVCMFKWLIKYYHTRPPSCIYCFSNRLHNFNMSKCLLRVRTLFFIWNFHIIGDTIRIFIFTYMCQSCQLLLYIVTTWCSKWCQKTAHVEGRVHQLQDKMQRIENTVNNEIFWPSVTELHT